MRRKVELIYMGLAIITVVMLSVILLHIITGEEEQNQQYRESKLPSGNYLPDAKSPLIRVVIKTNGFRGIAHTQVQLTAAEGITVRSGEKESVYQAKETCVLKPDDVLFQKGTIWVEANNSSDRISIPSLKRGYGTPSYRGRLELYATAEGIVIVNELPLEEYLYAVVPSEMPASYAPEALKCQAVCARSYAYCQMLQFGYPEYNAHVDDSTSYQVYGNSGEQETTNQAVRDTAGQKLRFQNQVVKTYYYSTSCGKSTSIEAWGSMLTENNQYLCGVDICNEDGTAYEKDLPWYQWKATIPEQTLGNLIELNTGMELGSLQDITVTKRGAGGCVLKICATGTKGSVTVETENKIRAALGGEGYRIKKQDGTTVSSSRLLPSAFFAVAKKGENYIIEGGGYGHGIGMSQNGANEMAKAGKTYEEILLFFYPGTKVE